MLHVHQKFRNLLRGFRIDKQVCIIRHRFLCRHRAVKILIRPEDLVDVVMDTLGIGDRTDGIRLQHIVNRFHFFRTRIVALPSARQCKRHIPVFHRELTVRIVGNIRIVPNVFTIFFGKLFIQLFDAVLLPGRKAHAVNPVRLLCDFFIKSIVPARLRLKMLRCNPYARFRMIFVQNFHKMLCQTHRIRRPEGTGIPQRNQHCIQIRNCRKDPPAFFHLPVDAPKIMIIASDIRIPQPDVHAIGMNDFGNLAHQLHRIFREKCGIQTVVRLRRKQLDGVCSEQRQILDIRLKFLF